MQSMRVLQLLYHCGYHDPVAEVKQRKKQSDKRIACYEKHAAEIAAAATATTSETIAHVELV